MANPICLSPLKFYDNISKQNRYRSFAYGHVAPLITNPNVVTPFCINLGVATKQEHSIKSVELYDANTNKLVGTFTERFSDAGLHLEKINNCIVIWFLGIFPLSGVIDFEGQYFLAIKEAVFGYVYSEVFCFSNNIDDCLRIEYWNPEGNLYVGGMYPIFPSEKAFHYILLLKSELGKPEYSFEEEATKRLGYSFIESQVSKKTYKFNTIIPEYLCDAMRIIRLCSKKQITCKGETYNAMSFNMEVEWQEQGDLASATCEFDVDNIITNLGGFMHESLGGDYNSDYNDDFNNEYNGGQVDNPNTPDTPGGSESGGSSSGGSGSESGGSSSGGSGSESGGSSSGGSESGGSGSESGGSSSGGSESSGSSQVDKNLIKEAPITDDTISYNGATYHADLIPGSKIRAVVVSDANLDYSNKFISAAVIRTTAPVKGSMDEQIADASLSELSARKPYLLITRAGFYDMKVIEMDNAGSFFTSKAKTVYINAKLAKGSGKAPFDVFTDVYSTDSASGYFPCDGLSVGIMNDIPQDASFARASRFPFIYVSCAKTKSCYQNSIIKIGLSGKLDTCTICESELMPYVGDNSSNSIISSPSTYYDCSNTIYAVPTEGKYYNENWGQIQVGKGDKVVFSIGKSKNNDFLRVVEYDSDFLQSVGLYYDTYNGSFTVNASNKAKHTFKLPYFSKDILSFVVYNNTGVILFDDFDTLWFINVDTDTTAISEDIDESRIIKKVSLGSYYDNGLQCIFIFRGQLYGLSATSRIQIVKLYFAD